MHDKKSEIRLPENPEEFAEAEKKANACFRNALSKDTLWAAIPLVNYTPLHELKDGSLVRFRGMVQDMLDPEIYLERYEVQTGGGATRMQEGKFRDCLVLQAGETVDYDSSKNVHGERRTLFVVTIPGLNTWSHDFEEQCNQDNRRTSASAALKPANEENGVREQQAIKKRPAPDLEDSMDVDANTNNIVTPSGDEPNKRLRAENAPTTANSNGPLGADYLLNSPIPDRPGKACMIKVYSDFDAYMLNTIVDVVGFLSVDPALDCATGANMDIDCESASELQAQNPPPSLIPRLHAIAVHRLAHANPLLDNRFTTKTASTLADATSLNMSSISSDLRKLLNLCLFNDQLAADYLLAHLISTVYSRSELQSIGKFTLNVCNLPKDMPAEYTRQLYDILALLLPASHFLPLTLDTMNSAAFVPKKDYETNKLVSGLLQLAPQTHLVLDETQLQQGKLEAGGVLSVQNLAHLINHQQIKCNFQYYQIDYNADIPVLVLSEGRSMLPNDFTVPLQADSESVKLFDETLKAAHHYLQQPLRLEQFRRFLTAAKMSTFNMNAPESEMIQADFVEMRKANAKTSVDDLHGLLVLSRLQAIAHGKDVLDRDSWELAKGMEAKRRQRVNELPKSSLRTRN